MTDLQEIYLEPKPDGCSYALTSANVQIHACRNYTESRDSSLIKSTVLVDYRWEPKSYKGNLVAVHRDGEFLAYILHGREGCHVRIYHRPSKSRALIKNFSGQALDLSWAFSTKPVFLGAVDEGGNLFVYRVTCCNDELKVAKYFHLKRAYAPTADYRLIWCPYVSDEAPTDQSLCDLDANALTMQDIDAESSNKLNKADGSMTDAVLDSNSDPSNANRLRSFGLLALSYGCTVEVLDLEPLIENHGREVDVAACQHGFASFSSRSEIMALALSPDATALAVANQSGGVVFYIMESLYEVREAHHWVPHQGRPVSAIYFLDDVTVLGKDAHFWKYALTTSDNNRELKIFNCENWSCVNTLRITSPGVHSSDPLIIAMDWTANYVFLSDIDCKSLYILQISQTHSSVKFVSFAEFPLVHPTLSVAIVEASKRRFRPFSPGGFYDLDRSDDGEDEFEPVAGIRALLYVVNPKSLRELEIRYQPNIFDGGDSNFDSTISSKVDSYHDHLSDLSSDINVLARSELPPVAEFTKILTLNNNTLVDVNSPAGTPTPIHSATSADHMKINDVKNNDQVSTSPSSEEVRNILLHGDAQTVDDHQSVPPYEEDDVEAVESTNLRQRVIELPFDEVDDVIGGAAAEIAPMSVADVVEPKSASSAQTSSEQLSSRRELREQFDRMFSYIKKQEEHAKKQEEHMKKQEEHMKKQLEEIQCLKLSVCHQSELLQGVASSVYTSEQQMKANEELLKAYQSFGPDKFESQLVRILEQSVQQQLESCVKIEIRNAVYEVMSTLSNTISETLQVEIDRKLLLADTTYRDCLAKMVQSKPVLETLGKACGQSVADLAHAAYKDTFLNIVVPSFESASRALFSQINDIFHKGTSEYLNQLEKQTSASRNNLDDFKASALTQLTTSCDQLKSSFDKLSKSFLTQVQSGLDKSVQSSVSKILNETLTTSLRTSVKDEMKKTMSESQQLLSDVVVKAIRSQAATPTVSASPQADRNVLQKEIELLLKQNNIAAAFQQALNALDLNLVVYVCGKVSANELFSASPCPLSQPIILSLIQQLSNDLTSHTDLKLRYLIEAVASIDVKCSPLQQQNMIRVMDQLKYNLEMFACLPAASHFTSQLKILKLAARSYLK